MNGDYWRLYDAQQLAILWLKSKIFGLGGACLVSHKFYMRLLVGLMWRSSVLCLLQFKAGLITHIWQEIGLCLKGNETVILEQVQRNLLLLQLTKIARTSSFKTRYFHSLSLFPLAMLSMIHSDETTFVKFLHTVKYCCSLDPLKFVWAMICVTLRCASA